MCFMLLHKSLLTVISEMTGSDTSGSIDNLCCVCGVVKAGLIYVFS